MVNMATIERKPLPRPNSKATAITEADRLKRKYRRRSNLVKRFGYVCLAVHALWISSAAYGAQETISWENGALCKFETRYDPAKYDEERLRNTTDVLFLNGFDKQPSLILTLKGPGGRLRSNVTEYQQACERERERVTSLPVIDLPGIENFRKWSLDALEDACRFFVLQGRAAAGDPAALREFTPSAPKCSPFIDALEGKTDIRAVWRDVIDDNCRKNSRPDECKANFLEAESKASPEDAIKRDVLNYGWNTCSTEFLKQNNLQLRDSMRAKLEKEFRRRFRVKAFPCSD
jgi:hypothetical protein